MKLDGKPRNCKVTNSLNDLTDQRITKLEQAQLSQQLFITQQIKQLHLNIWSQVQEQVSSENIQVVADITQAISKKI